MSLKETLIVLCIIFSVSLVRVKSERVLVHNSGECDQNVNTKLNSILSKLHDLELKINLMMPQHQTQNSKDTQNRFLESQVSSTKSRQLFQSSTTPLANCNGYCPNSGRVVVKLGKDRKETPLLCEDNHWLVVLNRFDGSVIFNNKNWQAYKDGIGQVNVNSEFFLGLQKLHEITNTERYSLLIKLTDFEDVERSAFYSEFSVGDEQSAFKLFLGSYIGGDAGDSFSYHEGQGFTTLDRDNDAKRFGNCGEEYNSAGWFKSCMEANLFGAYVPSNKVPEFKQGLYWDTFKGPDYSLKSVQLLIRPKC